MFNNVKKFYCNNIPVIYQHNNTKCTSVIIQFNIGSLWENEKEKGIAHLVEHLMFKDTGIHSSESLLKKLEISGASINACTGFDFTRFYFTVNNDSFIKTLKLFIEMLKYKKIPGDEFEKEKSTVIQELKMSLDDPGDQVYYNMTKKIFNIDPIIGFEKTLNKLKLKDVYSWIDKYFNEDNMIVSVNSSFSKNKIKKILNKELSVFKSCNLNNLFDKNKGINKLTCNYGKTIFKYKKDINQNYIIINYPIKINNDKDIIVMEFFRKILSSGLTSILFRIVREKYGYCYSIKAFSDILFDKDFRKKIGYNLNIVTSCAPEYVDKCIKQIIKVMTYIKAFITEEDIIKIKNKYKNSEKRLLDYAEINLDNYELFGKVKNDINKIFENITMEDLLIFMNNIIINKRNISIYGPKYKK